MIETESRGAWRWADRLLPENLLSDDPAERMRQRLLVSFGVLLSVVTVPWFLAMLALDPVVRLPRASALIVVALLACSPLWLRVLSTRTVAWATVLSLHATILLSVALNGGLVGPIVLVLPCLPALTAVLLGTRLGWLDVVLVTLSGGLFELLAHTLGLPVTAPPEIWPLVRVMGLAIGLGIMMLAVSAFLDLNDSQSRELRHLAHHDRLTGLFNRHFMAEILPSEIARVARRRAAALREGRPLPCLGFILVDLDHFKQINDTWSHSVGDQVLGRIAEVIAGAARTSDVVARWGGEEFFVLLRDLQLEGLSEVPARILDAVRGLEIIVEPGRPLPLTCSLGFTHFPCGEVTGTDCWELALKLAGFALLEAKQSGRDRGIGYVWGRPPSSRDGAGEALADVAAAVEREVLRRVEVLPETFPLPRSPHRAA